MADPKDSIALTRSDVAKKLGLSEAHILDFKDYGKSIRIVTVDGCKLDSGEPDKIKAWKLAYARSEVLAGLATDQGLNELRDKSAKSEG